MVAVARINREAFPRGNAIAGAAINVLTKRWALGSLLIWAGTIATGRLLAYTYHVLFATQLP
jgi:hypothetical protein